MKCMFRRFYEFATGKKLECKNEKCELYGVGNFCDIEVKKKKRIRNEQNKNKEKTPCLSQMQRHA